MKNGQCAVVLLLQPRGWWVKGRRESPNGTDGWPPFEMVDEETKEIIGLISIDKAIGGQSFEVEMVNINFDALIPALLNASLTLQHPITMRKS